MFDEKFIRDVVAIAYDEVQRVHGINLRDKQPVDSCLNTQLTITLVQAMLYSVIICYHQDLRNALKQKGIDISSLDPAEWSPGSSDERRS